MTRLLLPEEAVKMAPLGQAFFDAAKLPGQFDVTRFVKGWERILRARAGVVVGYFDDAGELRGGAGAYITPDVMTTDTVAYESFFYVDPAFRGRGTSLLKGLEDACRLEGANRLWMIHLAWPLAGVTWVVFQLEHLLDHARTLAGGRR
jgi:GNAT superfamily N-acetyltransferase